MFANPAILEKFYLDTKGMAWAAGTKYLPLPGLPGHKIFSFTSGDLYLTDVYVTTPLSLESAGTTVIYIDNQPVWMMNYWGWYEQEAIPFLKQVLLYQYNNRREFTGGRGPRIFHGDSLTYINNFRGNFSGCSGREDIFQKDKPTRSLGHHQIRCKILV